MIGQCKVIATRYSNDSQDCRVNNYNCTASSGKVVCGIAHSRLTELHHTAVFVTEHVIAIREAAALPFSIRTHSAEIDDIPTPVDVI